MQKPKSFTPWQPEQSTLLPPSPREWLSEDHQVYFLLYLVDELNLSEILIPAQAKYPRGEKGFDPRMLTMLLLYAYCVAGLIQSVSQAFLPGLRAWVEVGGIAPSQCPKAFLPQPISI